ncbi:hypothetical protein D3OALGB2SA_3650 [Olavius algarvensis associated proteobacterium Delta 3]|nr:hypothetical protein D3OALGB2SA_3650 [Olavius algarvensis associated proteobacterium Delta 3]
MPEVHPPKAAPEATRVHPPVAGRQVLDEIERAETASKRV